MVHRAGGDVVSGAARITQAGRARGTVFLHAAARRSGVKVLVIATVFEAGEDR